MGQPDLVEAPIFSIIMPVKCINAYVRESVGHIQNLNRQDWELIVLPNQSQNAEWSDDRIKIEGTGRVSPGEKRNIGVNLARGEIIVFIDDDSYPEENFLDEAHAQLLDPNVDALGGPAITPEDANYWERVSGAVFLSKWSGGVPMRYIPQGEVREVDDWPSVNFVIRRRSFKLVGGFISTYWPGEDTKFCYDLVVKFKKKIFYVPTMRVRHHRRTSLWAHLKQIGGYGYHRGHLAKRYPENSRKCIYFIPSVFLIFAFATAVVPLIWSEASGFFILGWVTYAVSQVKAVCDILKFERWSVVPCAVIYTIATHIWYGYRFIQGFMATQIKSRLR